MHQQSGRPPLRPGFLGGLVVVWTMLAFLPVIENDFVNWDDFRMFLDNPALRGPWEGRLRIAWGSNRLGEYMPVTWMTYAVDRSLWGDDASGYHLTSLLYHAATALAVLALARCLLRQALGPGPDGRGSGLWVGPTVAALVFGVHPMRVEAVAWASARGTIVGGLLLVLSVLVYVDGWEHGRTAGRVPAPWLAGSLALFAASLLARATGLVLPAVLMALDVYPFRRLGGAAGRWLGPAVRVVWTEKLGFVVLAFLAVPMAYLARVEQVADFRNSSYDPGIALAWGVYSPAFYLWKLFVPGDLSPIYPMPAPEDPMIGLVFLSVGAVVGITAGLIALRRRWPGALAAWVVYGLFIVPLSGILPFGRLRGVADRYTYVACIGWAIGAGAVVALGWRSFRKGRVSPVWAGSIGVAILAILVGWSFLSWHQVKVWRNGLTLWGWALRVAPNSPVVQNNLGWAFAHTGELARAEAHVRRAAVAWPNDPRVLQTLGRIQAAQGRFEESAETFRRAVKVAPRWPEGQTDLGSVLYEAGATDRALEHLQRAVQFDPGEPRAREHLARALAAVGRAEEAEVHLRRAAEIRGRPWPPPSRSAPPGPDTGASGVVPGPPREPMSGGVRPRRRRDRPGGKVRHEPAHSGRNVRRRR